MSCYAWSEEETSMLGFWILQFPAALHVCPVFFPGTRFPPPALRPHGSSVLSRERNKQKPNSSSGRTSPANTVPRQSCLLQPQSAPISMPGTCKNLQGIGSPVVNGTQKLQGTSPQVCLLAVYLRYKNVKVKQVKTEGKLSHSWPGVCHSLEQSSSLHRCRNHFSRRLKMLKTVEKIVV